MKWNRKTEKSNQPERNEEEVGEWEFVKGQRGSELLLADGHTFHCDKDGYYRCSHRDRKKKKSCLVRIVEKERKGEKYFVYTKGKKHEHEPKYINRREMKETIEKIVEHNMYKERNIMYIMIKTYKIEWEIKSTTYFKYIMNAIREKKEAQRKKIEERKDEYILYKDEEIIILADPYIFPCINLCDRLYEDGTFRVAPEGMYQLYTIHGTIEGEKYPLFYCVMKNRKMETYKRLYSIINKETGGMLEKKEMEIMGDYEVMDMGFFKEKKRRICCYFHYCQIIRRRRVKKCCEGLRELLMILPLVPIQRVREVYLCIKEKYTSEVYKDYPGNIGMLKYYEENFMENKNRPIESWNVSMSTNRTNNICESFHKSLNSFFKCKHPSIEEFIIGMIEYIEMIREKRKKGIEKEFERKGKKEEKTAEIKRINEGNYSEKEMMSEHMKMRKKYRPKNEEIELRRKLRKIRLPFPKEEEKKKGERKRRERKRQGKKK